MQASGLLDPRAVLGAVKAQLGNVGASRKQNSSNLRPDTLMQDRRRQFGKNQLATHGRTIHVGQNQKSAAMRFMNLPMLS
jgi:hypothetical protein